MITDATPITYPGPPPAQADVVVLGGGIIGVMTAWFLAKQGTRVVLCEKGRIAGEQSSRNWGWIRQTGRDPAELPIVIEALRIWESLAQEFGDALGFRRTGVMYLAKTAAEMAGFADWLPHATHLGVDSRLLTGPQAASHLKGAAAPWAGALHTPSDARAEPWAAVPLLAAGAAARGAVIVEGCAVRALDIAAGRVNGVITEQGRIACTAVVVAGGVWSSLFLRAHGVAIPQLAVLSSVAATEPLPSVFEGGALDDEFAFRRRADGGYTLAHGARHDFYFGPDAIRHIAPYWPVFKKDFRSTRLRAAAPRGYPDAWGTPRRWDADRPSPFEATRILNPAPNMVFLGQVQDAFARAFPTLGRPKLRAAWAGMIDTMPDVVPVVDHAPTIPGLTIATGMSGHGFGIGPAFGRIIADMVTGRTTGYDMTRFRLSRFTDRSPLMPGPSL
jgi:glycine/D-amino acid oxidase-like deaminating enzyme